MSAYTLSGKITDTKGEGLAYAAVYVKGTSKGTTSNELGIYSLELAPGQYTVIYQLIGFQQKQVEVDLTNGNVVKDVQLVSNSIELKPVTITDGEDPAYAIIRNAQKKRKYYLEKVNSYSCDVYIKGLQRVTEHPEKIMGMEVDVDGEIDSATGIVYLSESVSKFNFQRPDKIKEEMISSKVSGDNKAFSYNRASEMLFNFYENTIELEGLSERAFVSPIAWNSMFYYKFRLIGTYMENDSLVNKIEVIPRRKTDPCFHGFIYISENSWRIHSIDLYLTKDAQIDFVDTLVVNQTFVPVEKDVWMVFTNTFKFNFGFMGIKGNGYFVGVNRNYVIEPDFPKRFFNGEEMKVTDEANKKDSSYWAETRPVPLTKEEELDYRKRDSLMALRNSKPYLDSVDRKRNIPTLGSIVFTGYFFSRTYNKFSVGVSPLVRSVSYNTVQGWRGALDLELYKSWENRKSLRIEQSTSYGFSDQRFYADGELIYSYNPVRFSRIAVSGGTTTQQFNDKEPVPVFINTLYTLLDNHNYLKIYRKQYGAVNWYSEIVNGLFFFSGLEYADRSPLYNTSNWTIVDYPERKFTSNNPLNPLSDALPAFTPHQALTLNVQLSIRFKQKYYTRPNQKIILGSKYPALGIQYRKGIKGVMGSSTDFDFVKLSVRDEINLKLLGKFSYYAAAGKYLNSANLPFMDYYHFFGNRTLWSNFVPQSFQLLDYYTYSTPDWFTEVHLEQRFGGFIFSKLPLLKKLHLTEIVGFNWFMTETVPSYYEIFFGADKFGLLRIDFAMGYMQNAKVSAGIRFGLKFQ
ncbi:MAG: DUF5686 and carboxypeptidase regulatory-like domain-containing protein [Bacteroidia bacterium]